MDSELDQFEDDGEIDAVLYVCHDLLMYYNDAMNLLFQQPQNKWLNIYHDWLIYLPLPFWDKFKKTLEDVSITTNELKQAYVMWLEPPPYLEKSDPIILFSTSANDLVSPCTYNRDLFKEYKKIKYS